LPTGSALPKKEYYLRCLVPFEISSLVWFPSLAAEPGAIRSAIQGPVVLHSADGTVSQSNDPYRQPLRNLKGRRVFLLLLAFKFGVKVLPTPTRGAISAAKSLKFLLECPIKGQRCCSPWRHGWRLRDARIAGLWSVEQEEVQDRGPFIWREHGGARKFRMPQVATRQELSR
jgi:hypothetical protein